MLSPRPLELYHERTRRRGGVRSAPRTGARRAA